MTIVKIIKEFFYGRRVKGQDSKPMGIKHSLIPRGHDKQPSWVSDLVLMPGVSRGEIIEVN